MSAEDRAGALADAVHAGVLGALGEVTGGAAEAQPAEVLEDAAGALAGCEVPGVLVHAAPSDGVTGPLVMALTVAGARRVAAVLGAIDEEEAEVGGDLGDRELSAVRDVTARIAAAVGQAATAVVDRDVAFRPASVRVVEHDTDLRPQAEPSTQAAVVRLTVLGEPCRVVLHVPTALVSGTGGIEAAAAVAPEAGAMPLSDALRTVNVRVWAELGRTRMPTGAVVGLPSGAIVELDRDAEDAVDLYVDGQHYATGRLVVTDDESWGVRIEQILTSR